MIRVRIPRKSTVLSAQYLFQKNENNAFTKLLLNGLFPASLFLLYHFHLQIKANKSRLINVDEKNCDFFAKVFQCLAIAYLVHWTLLTYFLQLGKLSFL